MIDLGKLALACRQFLEAHDDDFEKDTSHMGPGVQAIFEALGVKTIRQQRIVSNRSSSDHVCDEPVTIKDDVDEERMQWMLAACFNNPDWGFMRYSFTVRKETRCCGECDYPTGPGTHRIEERTVTTSEWAPVAEEPERAYLGGVKWAS